MMDGDRERWLAKMARRDHFFVDIALASLLIILIRFLISLAFRDEETVYRGSEPSMYEYSLSMTISQRIRVIPSLLLLYCSLFASQHRLEVRGGKHNADLIKYFCAANLHQI